MELYKYTTLPKYWYDYKREVPIDQNALICPKCGAIENKSIQKNFCEHCKLSIEYVEIGLGAHESYILNIIYGEANSYMYDYTLAQYYIEKFCIPLGCFTNPQKIDLLENFNMNKFDCSIQEQYEEYLDTMIKNLPDDLWQKIFFYSDGQDDSRFSERSGQCEVIKDILLLLCVPLIIGFLLFEINDYKWAIYLLFAIPFILCGAGLSFVLEDFFSKHLTRDEIVNKRNKINQQDIAHQKYLIEKEEEIALKNDVKAKYQEVYKSLCVPENCDIIEIVDAANEYQIYDQSYFWKCENTLNAFSLLYSAMHFSWEVSDILYFKMQGDIRYEQKIIGGGSNGSSIGGAVAGALIAGHTGAVIGSRAKTNPIQSETIKHDNRRIILQTKTNAYAIPPSYYRILLQVIPEKEYDVVQLAVSQPDGVIEKIKKLSELHKDGILTDNEFACKKAELLAQV